MAKNNRRGYLSSIRNKFTNAVRRIGGKLIDNFSNSFPVISYQEIVDKALYVLFGNWNNDFITEIEPDVRDYTQGIYRRYRYDKGIFSNVDLPIAQVSFTLSDIRAIEYFRQSDMFYLGRFITDDDTIRRVTEFIRNEYLENGSPIGKSPEQISKFREAFEGVLEGEDWKIRRIIDTTVSRMRVTANLHYMKQAGVNEFEVLEVMDELTCPYCRAMNGKIFGVDEVYSKVENMNFESGASVKREFPFITSVFNNADRLDGLTSQQLFNMNITVPPYHPHCRGTLSAVL